MINKFAALLLIGMASPYQILDWYGGRHTCHTASGALEQSNISEAGRSSSTWLFVISRGVTIPLLLLVQVQGVSAGSRVI